MDTSPLEERCDGCANTAIARATLPSGGSLHFCASHWEQHEGAVLLVASEVFDAREQ